MLRIRYSNGNTREGILLDLTSNETRVALKDPDDVARFRLVRGQWVSEQWEPVVFEVESAPFLQSLLACEEAGEHHSPYVS